MTAIPPDPPVPPLRRPAPDLLDQRQQQIDPAGHHRRDPQNPPGAGPAPTVPADRGAGDGNDSDAPAREPQP